jgi:hypothetical protein
MKKAFVFILAFIYLAEVSGMSLYKHYCMDRLVSWGLTKSGKVCSGCGMEKEHSTKVSGNGCCKDEQQVIKLSADHKVSMSTWSFSLLEHAVPFFTFQEFVFADFGNASKWNSIHAPPLKHKVHSYLFNCVFRI